MSTNPKFTTKNGFQFEGFSKTSLQAMHAKIEAEYGVLPVQTCEAASYSMAMVVRYALGLSASQGRVACLVRECRPGWVALATLRHLVNAGARAHVLLLSDPASLSPQTIQQISPLKRMGVTISDPASDEDMDAFVSFMNNSHNVICGVYNYTDALDPGLSGIVDLLNELSTPIHTIEAPIGLDVETGQSLGTPMYASSTLSLGAPFVGLHAGSDFVGRHYVCDVSFTSDLYKEHGNDLTDLFSEQPVQQIYTQVPQKEEIPA